MLNNVISIFGTGAAAGGAGDFESIATVTVGSGGSSYVEFTSIPSTYKHLQIRALVTSSSSDNGLYMTMNADTGNNYKNHFLQGNGSSTSSFADPTSTTYRNNLYVTSNLYSSNFAGVIIDILDYTNTNKNTTIRSLSGNDRNGAGTVWLISGFWNNTSAVSSLKFTSETNIAQYSHFALYGVKG